MNEKINKIRVQKYLADNGIASRRKCEEYILEGRVKVNGKVITQLGMKIDLDVDKVEFDNKLVKEQNHKEYILLNKPIGYVTTVKDQFGRPTVMELIKSKYRVVPVGRLDMYTSGALILTNDGDFINKITHPKHEIEKTYNVTIRGEINNSEIDMLKNGVDIDGYITKPAKVRILKVESEKNITRIEIKIHEGKNRQVRKMLKSIGKNVIALHRAAIGTIKVNDLKIGQYRNLTEKEIKNI